METAKNVQVLLVLAQKLGVTVEVDVEFCAARKCDGACMTTPDGVVIKLASLENERTLAHELVHAFQRMTGEYLWEEEDLDFWGNLEGVPLDVDYLAIFASVWQKGSEERSSYFSTERKRKELLAYYVGCASNGMNVFWRIAKTVLESVQY
jgi:hypothetical protein